MARGDTYSFTLLESDAKYFGQIPANCLKVLKLLHHEKMNYAEITKQVGWPSGTVCRRINRAREIIKRLRAADVPAETMQAPTHGVWAGVGLSGRGLEGGSIALAGGAGESPKAGQEHGPE